MAQYWPAGVCKQLNCDTCTRVREDMLLIAKINQSQILDGSFQVNKYSVAEVL